MEVFKALPATYALCMREDRHSYFVALFARFPWYSADLLSRVFAKLVSPPSKQAAWRYSIQADRHICTTAYIGIVTTIKEASLTSRTIATCLAVGTGLLVEVTTYWVSLYGICATAVSRAYTVNTFLVTVPIAVV